MRELRAALLSAGIMLLAMQRADAALIAAHVGCAATAEAAVARILGSDPGVSRADGFKVVAVRTDALRKQSWAMVASCSDATRPLVAIALDFGASIQTLDVPQGVRIGDRVAVVLEGEDSRLNLSGWAEDSGAAQELIRVKLPRFSTDDGSAAPVIRCRVVGKDLVEVAR
jgi:hypothetical protein